MRSIRYIVVHHTGSEFSTMATIRATHVLQNQWRDIGYHYVIYKDGTVHKGRPDERPGAHTKDFNAGSLGVCLCGNLNKAHPTAAQLEALGKLVGTLCKVHGIPAERVLGHRETAPFVPIKSRTRKTCPGTNTNMNVVREWVKANL